MLASATPLSTRSDKKPTPAEPDRDPRLVPFDLGPEGELTGGRPGLLFNSFSFFMSEVHDDLGHELLVEPHTEEWCDLLQHEPLLVLMAPRDHGKSVCVRCYILWLAWRHNRDPETGRLKEGNPDGRFEVVIFSEILDQATEWFELMEASFLANPALFGDILPDLHRGRSQLNDVWSKRRLRLRNGFEAKIRAWRTSTRGLHPDVIILDDVLSDENTLTKYQRDKSWTYFIGTLMPMNASEVKVVGTALHFDDLLHRLQPDPKKAPLVVRNRLVRFRWVKYRSVNWDTGMTLWPDRHSLVDLQGRRDLDALLFSREWQNDPRDDASSLFPFELTKVALDQGAELGFPAAYHKLAGDYIVAGYDLAASESVGADYCVLWVAVYNRLTQQRRILYGRREQGMSFHDQLLMLRTACQVYDVDVGVVEENGFQKWLYAETLKYPETARRIIGHRTGREKASLADGVPSMKLSLLQKLWTFPTATEQSRRLSAIWQSEMSAFGWKDDKLQGVGEHDDCVMAFWFVDRAIRIVDEWLSKGPAEEVVTGADIGIERYRISADY